MVQYLQVDSEKQDKPKDNLRFRRSIRYYGRVVPFAGPYLRDRSADKDETALAVLVPAASDAR